LAAVVSWTSSTLRGVGKRLDDPVFGPVAYQGYSTWRAERNLEALGGRLVIEVPGPRATGPSHEYADLLRGLVERQQEIAWQAEESVFREYQALGPGLRRQLVVGHDWISETYRKALPILERPSQIWALLSGGCITLEEGSEQPGCFSVSWECSWGIEYGDVSRTFVNWKLQEDEEEKEGAEDQ
jgi:hypothetical protein